MKYSLSGKWLINSSSFKNVSVNVPGSVLSALLDNNLICDPFVGKNELKVFKYLKEDYEFKRSFKLDKEALDKTNYLFLNGIDTIAEVYINDNFITSVKDMHICYKVLLNNDILKEENEISIKFKSAIKYIENIDKNKLFYSWGETMKYSPALRKANYMFGWDWGPNLPDMGIFRETYILSTDIGYLDSFRHYEKFNKDKSVTLTLDLDFIKVNDANIKVTLSNDNQEFIIKESLVRDNRFVFNIENPKLWNPIGYGEPNLYKVLIEVVRENERQKYNYKIGLRKIYIDDSRDEYGLQFKLYVNGNPVFIKGSDFIPQDNILSRVTYENTYKLLKLAKDFNHNTIRIWGGGYYLDDYFYDICDELGLLVFEDYMFACGLYDTNDKDFMELIKEESIYTIKRIRHHASIFMICGNNENEVAITSWEPYRTTEAKKSFIDLYLGLLKDITKKYSNFYYLESSPTSREPYFVNPNDYNNLDMHYWDVWHGYKPFSAYKEIYPRLLSEFGCQSFPLYETVLTYAKENELDIFSDVMMHHQKNRTCNDKILGYIRSMYKEPKDFRSLVYLSHLTQAEGIKTCVEHLRSNRGRCEGVIYWQLNDCWPGQSWSSLDYYLRPKALHYYSKKFYEGVMLLPDIKDNKFILKISNDNLDKHKYKVKLSLENFDGKIISSFRYSGIVKKSSVKEIALIDNIFIDPSNQILKLELEIDNEKLDCTYYTPLYPKDMNLKKSNVKVKVVNDYKLLIEVDTFTKGIAIEYKDKEMLLSDNYFDLDKGTFKVVTSNKKINLKDLYITNLSENW